MKTKAITTILIMLFLASMLSMAFITKVKAQLTLPPILASADAYIRSDMAQFNFGSDGGLIVGRFPVGDGTVLNLMRSLITFDLPSIPSGAVVTSAKMYMYIDGLGYTVGALPRPFGAHRITSSWIEGDGTAPSPSLTGVTWNNQPSFLNTPTSTVLIYPGVVGIWVSWDITADVQNGYVNPSAWYGILIKDEHEDPPMHAYVHFYSRDQTHIPYLPFRPYLSITYEVIDPIALLEDLKDEIDELSDDDLKKPAAKRKVALLNKVDEVIAKVDAEDYEGAIMKLKKDIRPKLDINAKQTWLVVPHPELLTKIDAVVEILEGLL